MKSIFTPPPVHLHLKHQTNPNPIPLSDIIIFDEQTPKQTRVAFIVLSLLLVSTVVSQVILKRKRDILKSRGGQIIRILFVCHLSNIVIPNLVTVGLSLGRNISAVCIPKYLYLVCSHGLCITILLLILGKAFYMKLKSLGLDMTNVIGVMLTLIFMTMSFFLFYSLVFTPFMPRTSYRYLNICSLDQIDHLQINFEPFNSVGFLYITFVLMNHINIWGVKQEIFSLLVINLAYCLLKGWHHTAVPSCHFREELLESCYRVAFFVMNCFLFIWLFDDSKKSFRSVRNTDVYSIASWNKQLLKYFGRFLRARHRDAMVGFFEEEVKAKMLDWNQFQRVTSKRNSRHAPVRGAQEGGDLVYEDEVLRVSVHEGGRQPESQVQ